MMLSLEDLDTYLSSDAAPDACMMLSDLDGFLHGVACAPVPIPAEDWLPIALGSSPEDVPKDVLDTTRALHDQICAGLEEGNGPRWEVRSRGEIQRTPNIGYSIVTTAATSCV